MASDFADRIDGTDPIGANQPVKGFNQEGESTRSFQSYMEGQTPSQATNPNASGPTPAQLVSQQSATMGPPSMESVIAQMNTSSTSLGDLQNKLQTPNLNLKSSQKYLLRNKLTEANTQIRAAATKTGVDVREMPEGASSQNPMTRFLALVSDGQQQLEAAQLNVANLAQSGKTLNPAQLLLVQVKLAKAQQELEYSSIVLNNAISDVKMLFNVQL